jgi:GxxExxY protein
MDSDQPYYAEPDRDLDELARAVEAAAFEVHRLVGPGYLEAAYEEALAAELELRAIPFKRQVAITPTYKGRAIGQGKVDLLIDDRLVVELKACEALLPVHIAQVIAHLKATRHTLALLINFNVSYLRRGLRRIIRSS